MGDFELKKEHRQWDTPCETSCATEDFDYSDLAGGLPQLMLHILGKSEDGYGISSSVEAVGYDFDAKNMQYSERVTAAMNCARKIVSGECPAYLYTGAFSPAGRR